MSEKSKNNAEHYRWGENCDGWHLAKSDCLSVIQELVPHGSSEARHYHETSEQFFFVLSGTASIEVEGVTHEINAQQGIHISAGKAHRLSNQHINDLSFIVISTPPSHGDRVEL